MFVRRSLLVLVVVNLVPNQFVYSIKNESKATSGPYKIVVSKIRTCDRPSRPYIKNPTVTHSFTINNASGIPLLNGNVNVTQDTKNTKFKVKASLWEGANWRTIFLVNDMGCHSMAIQFMAQVGNVKYDRKKCVLFKGLYELKNIDADSTIHLWLSKMEYGKIMWKYELFSPNNGTLFCKLLETATEPAV